ncbi:Periplasmic (Fe) hydrogenase large subunit [Anaerovibrio sp. JC8]|uniref:[FeFe] hydrogenase, group A n=1 Tax=Anaerovibrio sp. JC8 TaxID=1240085 RepID=UPI000A0A5520|nr:[FeFe] hydrogenase, group A [Anaerovibrio sp. JC8]ORU01291.1 Periplasmic (Fe) hydrogenase large subunit [Anaerovibrio sp. JC8]
MSNKMSRRKFLKVVAGSGVLGFGVMAAGCKGKPSGGDGWVSSQYEGKGDFPVQLKGRVAISAANPSIERDDEKCILCGQCVDACKNVMGVYGNYPLPLKQEIACVGCGQCVMQCPSGAITEKSHVRKVLDALDDDSKYVVVQTAPATKVSLGEEFGMPQGTGVGRKMAGALKAAGFDSVFDTCFAADLTIMEEASEFVHRLTKKKDEIPHLTSCCPGWVKYCEYFYPELMHNLSTCKSPQNMMGATIKSFFAQKMGINPDNIVNVSIMPCTAKKFEVAREELQVDNQRDMDYVLTTRELAVLLKHKGIDLNTVPESDYDSVMGESTGAGRIFGATGGVTEAAVRTAYYLATGSNPPAGLLDWKPVRGMQAVKEATASIPGVGSVNIAVCHGLENVRQLLDGIKAAGSSKWQFIEFMACPGGCIGGGGQPKTMDAVEAKKRRIEAIYKEDTGSAKRCSHDNAEIQAVYKDFFGKPLSEKAEKYLHTTFVNRHGRLFD